MPDNKHIAKSSLADKGWQRMSAILDRELPAKRRRRAAAWLPWGLGVLVLLIALGWWAVGVDGDKLQNDTKPQEQRVSEEASAQSSDDAHKTADAVTSAVESPSVPESETTPAAVSTLPAGTAARAQGNIAAHPDNSEAELPVSDAIAESAVHSQSAVQHATPPGKSEIVAIPMETDLVAAEQAQEGESTLSNDDDDLAPELRTEVDEPSRILGFVALLDAPARTITPMDPKMKKDARFGLEAFSAGHVSDVVEVRGVEAGLAATFELSPKWTLRAGASFGHYQKNGLLRAGGASADYDKILFDPSAPQGGFIFYDPSTGVWVNNGVNADLYQVPYDTTRLLSHAFNYLHFPVSVEYAITTRLSISAGLEYTYLISAPTEFQVVNTPTIESNRSNSFLYDNNLLRKHDIAPEIGVGWRLSRRFTLEALYHHGLIPYVDQSGIPDRSDFNRSLAIGLRYKIL